MPGLQGLATLSSYLTFRRESALTIAASLGVCEASVYDCFFFIRNIQATVQVDVRSAMFFYLSVLNLKPSGETGAGERA